MLVAIAFLVGGFALINRFAPEASAQVGSYTITQRGLYTGLFCIGKYGGILTVPHFFELTILLLVSCRHSNALASLAH